MNALRTIGIVAWCCAFLVLIGGIFIGFAEAFPLAWCLILGGVLVGWTSPNEQYMPDGAISKACGCGDDLVAGTVFVSPGVEPAGLGWVL